MLLTTSPVFALFSKWFMKSIGHEGLNNLLAAYQDKSAKAVCTFAYSPGPGHEPILFQGITEGKIVSPRGPPVFGMSTPKPFSPSLVTLQNRC
jgi:inosine/xanthosine triphosphate pyrophosphatase family protein